MAILRLVSRTTLRTPCTRHLLRAAYSSSSTFQPSPAPPRLPADQQAEFERLQRAVSDRLADPTPLPHERAAAATPVTNSSRHNTTTTTTNTTTNAKDSVVEGGAWRGARPEFEGEKNPKTGEVGGPKTEPLRWGSGGDWSYNGRVTDF